MIVRLIATSMTTIYKYFEKSDSLEIVKVQPFLNGVTYAVSYWSERGGRQYQEDRFNSMKAPIGTNEASLYGVFDGHGGEKAAEYCRQHLLAAIAADGNWQSNPALAATRAFFKVDADFSKIAKAQTLTDGTTAVVAVIVNKKLYIANAGDSRAVLVQRGGKARAMSDDHRPERKDEEARIRKLGGTLKHWGRWRVEGVL
eukprot:gene40911-49901_t